MKVLWPIDKPKGNNVYPVYLRDKKTGGYYYTSYTWINGSWVEEDENTEIIKIFSHNMPPELAKVLEGIKNILSNEYTEGFYIGRKEAQTILKYL